MTYCVVRIYSGSGDRSIEDLSRHVVGKELAPQLLAANCRRYSTISFADGRVGSSSFYDNESDAQRGNSIAAKWAGETGAMKGYRLDQTIQGEVIFSLQGKGANAKEGEIRLYKTSATADDVRAVMETEGRQIIEDIRGLVRYTAVKTHEGVAALTAHDSRQSATELSNRAREARQVQGSKAQALLTQDPQIIQGTIIDSWS